MEKHWITAPAPRKGRMAWTFIGSILLHGAIIAVAALWPVRRADPAALEPPPTAVSFDQPAGDPEPPMPESNPAPPDVPSDPPPLAVDVSIDTPPTPEEPTMDIATPKPVVKNTVNKSHPVRPTTPGVSSTRSAFAAAATAPGVSAGAGRPGAVGHWHTPRPPYPYALRAARVAGSGSVRITTDATGRVTSASIVQSTGNSLLDENTTRFARSDWSGPPNATATVPITYQMP